MKFKKWLFGLGLIPMFALVSCNTPDLKETENRVSMSNSGVMTCDEVIANDIYAYTRSFKKNNAYTLSDIDYDFREEYATNWNHNMFEMIDTCLLSIDYDKFAYDDEISVHLTGNYTFSNDYVYQLSASDGESLETYLENEKCKLYFSKYEWFENYDTSFLKDFDSDFTYQYYSMYDSIGYTSPDGDCWIVPYEDFTMNTNGKTFDITMTRIVKSDTIVPDVNTDNHIIVNIDNMISLDDIKYNISAIDETDGNVSDNIELVSTTYNPNNKQLGSYEYECLVRDNSGNGAYATFIIDVVDITKPKLTGVNSYSFEYDSNDKPSIDSIINNLVATDNYDTSLNIVAITDSYSGNESVVGDYSIEFKCYDSSNNASDTFDVSVKIVDTKAPVITCPSIFETDNTKQLTISDLKSKIVVEDGYEGEITDYTITDNNAYSSKSKIANNYTFTIKASDSFDNESTFDFVLKVSDVISPVLFVAKDFVIVLPKGSALDKEMILKQLEKLGEIATSNVAECSFDVDMEKSGIYACSILMNDDSTYNFSIVVEDSNKFDFKELITKEYWQDLWKSYCSSWKNFDLWDWKNWTTITIASVLILGLLAFGISKLPKKTKNNKYWY